MAELQGLCRYPGIENVISAEYVLAHGISPGVCLITCAPQSGSPDPIGSLEFSFGGTTLRFDDCVPDKASYTFTESGLLWSVSIKDRRWKWAFGKLSGRYNLRLPDTTALIDKVEQLDFPTERTVRELMEECFKAMGEQNWSIPANLPADLRPLVEWDHSNPAQELAKLTDLCACRVVMKTDGSVSIENLGTGDGLPDGDIITDSGEFDPAERPSSILFVGGPTRYQCDVRLQAVGEEVDGRILPIDDLSYKPDGGWESADLVTFASIQDFRQRQLAFKCIYKWYRIHDIPQGADGKALMVAGRKDPIKQRRDMLPLGTEQVLTTKHKLSHLETNAPAIIYGIYFPGYPTGNASGNNYELPAGQDVPPRKFTITNVFTGQSVPEGGDTVIHSSFSIDQERGMVMFSEQLVKLNEDSRFAEALLILRTGCVVRDPETRTPFRYERERKLTSQIKTEPYVYMDNDLFLKVWPKPSSKHVRNEEEPDYDPIRPPSEDNEEDVRKAADDLLDSAEEVFLPRGGQMVTYAGIADISPSGSIHQVVWTIGQEPATTKASLNDEIGVLSVHYSERRFLEKAREQGKQHQKALAAMAAHLGVPFSQMREMFYGQVRGS